MSVVAALALVAPAWADHPGGPAVSSPMSPLTSALVFGGLALLAGMIVVVILALLTRRKADRE